MLEPSPSFYAAMFGALKAGAIAVPLFTLFGPDGVRLRVRDCTPRLLVPTAEQAALCRELGCTGVLVADAGFDSLLPTFPDTYAAAPRHADAPISQPPSSPIPA